MPGRVCTIFFIGFALAVAGCTGEAVTDTSVPDGSSTTSSTTPETSTTLPQGTTAANSDDLASLVFMDGRVLTMDRSNPLAEGVAILGGEILVAGMEQDITPYIGPKTMVIDLEGRTLMPGFVDAHTHYFANPDEFTSDMDGMQDHILSTGTTTIGAMSVGAELLDLMYLAAEDDAVRVRTNVYLSHNTVCGEAIDPWIPEVSPQPVWGERLRVGGIKLFTDGGACNVPARRTQRQTGRWAISIWMPMRSLTSSRSTDRLGTRLLCMPLEIEQSRRPSTGSRLSSVTRETRTGIALNTTPRFVQTCGRGMTKSGRLP